MVLLPKQPRNMSFIEYYNDNNIIPVAQKIDDLDDFYRRRAYLFRSLGLHESFLKRSDIAEFGPGTGQNADYFVKCGFKHLTLIDAANKSLECLQLRLMSEWKDSSSIISIVREDFRNYISPDAFDLVFAEGCIPHQSSPLDVLSSISRNVRIGGVIAVSCISGLSHLSETFRRVYASVVVEESHPCMSDLDKLTQLFAGHLQTLRSHTRYVQDWVQDVIIQRLDKSQLLSIIDVLHNLDANFIPYHFLPSLPSPFVWYKDYDQDQLRSHLRESYLRQNIQSVSRSLPYFTHDPIVGNYCEELGLAAWHTAADFQSGKADLAHFLSIVAELAKLISVFNTEFSESLLSLVSSMKLVSRSSPTFEGDQFFKSWWGRCQSYASFIRAY